MNETLCCSACGLLMQDVQDARQVNCPRCDTSVRTHTYSLAYSLALSIAALIVFLPAVTFPIFTFKLGGMEQENTLLSALYYFYNEGYTELSLLVLFTTVIAPFMHMVISLLMYYDLNRGHKPRYMKAYYRLLYGLRHWVMLDVYVIAMLVAIVKLSDTAELIYETGFVLFITMTIFSFLLCNSFEPKHIWRSYHDAH